MQLAGLAIGRRACACVLQLPVPNLPLRAGSSSRTIRILSPKRQQMDGNCWRYLLLLMPDAMMEPNPLGLGLFQLAIGEGPRLVDGELSSNLVPT